MDLEKVTAQIRPRRGWEAIDLGVSLVQQHTKVLYKIWLLTSLPAFILLGVIFYDSPEWAAFSLWLIKPILERPLLHFISRELFGESLSVKQCLKAFFSVAKIQWFASLTWRRFSFTRSLDLPLIQLEGLSGMKRANRLKTLHSGDSGSAVWLTIMFFCIEIIFYFSMFALIYLLVPEIYLEDFDINRWIFGEHDNLLVAHLLNLFAFIGMSLVAPFYIACGFALYINQRTHLEAWDIELSFKRLAAKLKIKSENLNVRLTSIALVLVLFSGSSLVSLDASAEQTNLQSQEPPPIVVDGSDAFESAIENMKSREPTQQNELTREQVKKLITDIRQGPDFARIEKEYTNRYRNSGDEAPLDSDNEPSSIPTGWLTFAGLFAIVIEFALWIFVAVLILFLILKYKHLLGNTRFNKKLKPTRPKKLFGLDLDSESLPDKPWEVARSLVEKEQYRQALSLLYRASLIWYIDHKNVLIKEGYTELECLQQIVKNVGAVSQGYIKKLTNTWRGLAYAHIQPDKAILLDLCNNWPKVMQVNQTANDKHSAASDLANQTIDKEKNE